MFDETPAQQDDAGFRHPVPHTVINRPKRGRRWKRPFTHHVYPQSTSNKALGR